MLWTDIFRRLLFLPVVFALALMFCKADAAMQYLNKVTNTITISITTSVEVKVPQKSLKFEPYTKVVFDESLVDLNTAEACDLDLLPGVGETRAEAIVLQRAKMGGFYSVNDVLCTPGIGLRTLSKIKDMVTVSKQ